MSIPKSSFNQLLVIASGNQGKIKEFKEFLSELPLNISSQPKSFKVEENGHSFLENARIKALAASNLKGTWTLADDSGLSVEALNGAPGIHSSRYAKTDQERINKLLLELKFSKNRKAIFTAALCIALNGKPLIEVEGHCEGLITNYPRGDKGFGYDPIFEVKGTGLTFAEMRPEQKKIFGHRGLAFQLLLPKLKQCLLLEEGN